jgi:hypothetical protein
MDEIDCGVEGRWGVRRTGGDADSQESGKSRNKFLSPLRTF